MTFKREISIDGVAAITAAVVIVVLIAKMSFTQDAQAETLKQHSAALGDIPDIKMAIVKIEARNQITDAQQERINDFETRIRELEKGADGSYGRHYESAPPAK